MCLIVFAYKSHPEYRLIMAANRDEFYQRPTLPASFWEDHPSVLAGRDQQAGGTWLGVNTSGRLAAITNFREGLAEPAAHSRGALTSNFLTNRNTPLEFARQIRAKGENYNGFNLLLADHEQLVYCSNRTEKITTLQPGVHSLSNHLLNTPWPKAEHSRQELEQLIGHKQIDIDALISCLHRREPFPDEHLPTTGISLEMERTLSPPFIVSEEYGTRCTTVVLWRNNGSGTFVEQSYLPGGDTGERRQFEWQMNSTTKA